MRIEVDPAGMAAAGVAAAGLARVLREAVARVDAVAPAGGGTSALTAWSTAWGTLRGVLLEFAAAGDEVSAAGRAAATRVRETESGVARSDGG